MWKRLTRYLILLVLAISPVFLFSPIPIVGWDLSPYSVNITIKVTPGLGPLLPPSGFTLTDCGAITITANWTTGARATYTLIRCLRNDYPASIMEGEFVYYGESESVNTTGYALETTGYYFSAWGYDSDNVTVSSTYATATIGGDGMTDIATALTLISSGISAITGYIPTMIALCIMMGITGLAFWHRDKILFVLAGILIMIYGFGYWTTSSLTSIIIVGAGIAIFIKAFIQGKASA